MSHRRYVFERTVNVVHYAVPRYKGASANGDGRGLVTYCRGVSVGPECTGEVVWDAELHPDGLVRVCHICTEAAREQRSIDGDWGVRKHGNPPSTCRRGDPQWVRIQP